MSRIRHMIVGLIFAMGAMVTGTQAAHAQSSNSAGINDVAARVVDLESATKQMQSQLQAMCSGFQPGTSARGDCSIAQTEAARICSGGCETTREIEKAKEGITSLWEQVRYIKRTYATHDDLRDLGESFGRLIDGVNESVTAVQTDVTALKEWKATEVAWHDDMEAWRKAKDETDGRQDDAIISLSDKSKEHDERIHDLESVRGAAWCRSYAGAGFYAGTKGELVTGTSTPIFGGCGAELQLRDDKSRIWIIEGGFFGHFDPVISDTGAGGHLALGWVLNPLKKQDWSLMIGGEAMRLSTQNSDGFSDANRWDVRPGLELRHAWFVDRLKVDLLAFGRVTAGIGAQVADDIYNTHTSLTRFGASGGVGVSFALGPKWNRWVDRH